jgi:transposase
MMSKGTFFTGQPIFNQILNYIPRAIVQSAAREVNADYRYKSFKTYEHLVTMLYAIFNHCDSLREVTTGLLAWDRRIQHLGIDVHPRRSTLADANKNRSHEVFEKIYFKLLDRYKNILPDSRSHSRKRNLYIFDSTTISLFQEILKGVGHSKADGRRKGGIKVHTLLHAGQDIPTMIRYSAAAENDILFLKLVKLPAGSVVVFDKGYRHYASYNLLSRQKITWVTRHRDSSVYKIRKRCVVNDYQKQQGITADWIVTLGREASNRIQISVRIVSYRDPVTGKHFKFITNDFHLAPLTIANYYRQRWQIELFFKRIKQNYPLQYFLGDSENAIKIQIWCALIADLILKVVKKGTRSTMAFSNLNSLVRIHLMTYMDLKSFLRSPEKSLLRKIKQQINEIAAPSLFAT